eukprot:m.1474017 g.1474017  ORF g.1474017 m.1474017 type:complete len:256 (-) comp25152_c1_seq33:3346-4113(-)
MCRGKVPSFGYSGDSGQFDPGVCIVRWPGPQIQQEASAPCLWCAHRLSHAPPQLFAGAHALCDETVGAVLHMVCGSICLRCPAAGHGVSLHWVRISFQRVVVRVHNGGAVQVPQRPYNAIGSLAQQITYPVEPDLTDAATVATLDELMRMVKLSHLLERQAQGWGTTANWADVLSLGEQQRLGMARLFYHRPRYAVLDQCTDAVSVDVEDALYTQAKALGITIITISQRPGLTGHHDQHVRLIDGAGHWDIADMH